MVGRIRRGGNRSIITVAANLSEAARMSHSRSRGRSAKSSRSAADSVGNPQEGPSSFADATGDQPRRNGQGAKLGRSEKLGLTFVPWRIFVNHVDGYHGKKLAQTLLGRICAADARKTERGSVGKKNSARAGGEEDDDFTEEEGEGMNLFGRKVESRKFEVVGTAKDEEYESPENVATVIRWGKNRELLLGELMKCGVVIYDITQEDSQISEARWALEGIVEKLEKFRRESPKAFELSEETRYFILISTLMTWGLTKPLNPEDPDSSFTEADYRKRKPHPNFKEHIKCEREILTAAKRAKLDEKLKAVVVGSGITYGDEEEMIHCLFKAAWMNADFLPIFGPGDNKIPMLHVRDLVEVVCMMVEKWPRPKYVVACEQEVVTQTTIVKKISKALSTGKVKRVAPEEAFLLPEMTQRTYDVLNANIKIEPAYVVDNGLQWHFDSPFRDNVDAIVNEYKISRNLFPVKIIVLGPPASGKTRLARSLAKHYGIHYISVKNVIEETIEKLSNEIAASVSDAAKRDNSKVELEEVEDDEDDEDEVEDPQEQLDEIRNNLTANNERLDDDTLNKIFLRRLRSKDCQNQGYVMDGYPKTLSQARGLFGSTQDDEEVEVDEDDFGDTPATVGGGKIIPELVVVLEVGDEFLIERVVRFSEREIQGTHYTEEGMLRRLKEYRERNTDEESPLDLFDELEVHPLVVPVEDDVCPEMFATLMRCIERLGEPRNYGPTDAEREEAKKRAEAEALATSAIEEARKAREDFERKMARERKMVEWTNLLEKLKQEEAERLSILAEPLRQYLVKYIFPTLSQGLIEVARVRPEDPIDFLAEYLFRENPGGRMFEPDYTETMSMLLSAIEKLQEDILPSSDMDSGTAERYLKGQGQRGHQGRPCRKSSANEAEVLTEDDDDDDDGGCDEKRASRAQDETHMEMNDALAASSFSYEEIDGGSGRSFGNSAIHSREDSQ